LAAIKKHNIFVNFKTYKTGSGKNAETLTRKIAGKNVVLVVQNADIYRTSKLSTVFAQHVDLVDTGRFTGHDYAVTLKENGAKGVLINHSEDKAKLKEIAKIIRICRSLHLTSLVCAETPKEAEKIARLRPDIIAIEPPELIATGVSVSRTDPGIVTRTVNAVRKVNKNIDILCGAGVWTGDDVKKAIKLGCKGVLVASAVMTSKHPKNVVEHFVNAL